MLLYHRPVPAKIPKRRSRAGKPFLLATWFRSSRSHCRFACFSKRLIFVVLDDRLRSLVCYLTEPSYLTLPTDCPKQGEEEKMQRRAPTVRSMPRKRLEMRVRASQASQEKKNRVKP